MKIRTAVLATAALVSLGAHAATYYVTPTAPLEVGLASNDGLPTAIGFDLAGGAETDVVQYLESSPTGQTQTFDFTVQAGAAAKSYEVVYDYFGDPQYNIGTFSIVSGHGVYVSNLHDISVSSVPEPAPLALMGAGAAALMLRRRHAVRAA